MNTIGIRATPNEVYFAIYNSRDNSIVNVEKVVIPKVFDTSESLKFIRNHFLDIINEYKVRCAGIRLTESAARSPSKDRLQIEAVILEALSSSDVSHYYEGQIATITANIGIERDLFKKYVKEEVDLELVEKWSSHKKEEKEAILTAIGCIKND